MQEVIFAKFSRERKPIFQIQTRIVRNENNTLHIEKSAVYSIGKQHIDAMVQNCTLMREQMGHPFSVVPIVPQAAGMVEIPFVKGESLSSRIEKLVNVGAYSEAESVIVEFCQAVHDMAVHSFEACDEFHNVFGPAELDNGMPAMKPANIDLIFDNIIVDDSGRYQLIDCEWVFPFAIPVSYILFRSLYFSYGFSMMPHALQEKIWNRFGISEKLRSTYLQMEIGFQHYVSGCGRKLSENYEQMGKPCYQIEENSVVRWARPVIYSWQEQDWIKADSALAVCSRDDRSYKVSVHLPGKVKIVFPYPNSIVKFEVQSADGIPMEFETNSALQIVDDYYFLAEPEIYCNADMGVCVSYIVIEPDCKNLGQRIELLKKAHSQELALLQLEQECAAYKTRMEEYRSAYQSEAICRQQETNLRKEFEAAYQQEAKSRQEFEAAYQQEAKSREGFQVAYQQEANNRENFEAAYLQEAKSREEFQAAYLQEAKSREEFQAAYLQEAKSREDLQAAYDELRNRKWYQRRR